MIETSFYDIFSTVFACVVSKINLVFKIKLFHVKICKFYKPTFLIVNVSYINTCFLIYSFVFFLIFFLHCFFFFSSSISDFSNLFLNGFLLIFYLIRKSIICSWYRKYNWNILLLTSCIVYFRFFNPDSLLRRWEIRIFRLFFKCISESSNRNPPSASMSSLPWDMLNNLHIYIKESFSLIMCLITSNIHSWIVAKFWYKIWATICKSTSCF